MIISEAEVVLEHVLQRGTVGERRNTNTLQAADTRERYSRVKVIKHVGRR